ncbi:MAG TPA: Asp-tRNA(Asn)/Glu-tRNA(Gln) amidotransferase subunit GatB [Candidatus Polarisedimenticolia bacterium]|nr:Asp-tRNA(Asn)/Glu-tRNA(Gln) amidotransferase subunit GatB [Candidatus Polarisedimenticolia bacterium]
MEPVIGLEVHAELLTRSKIFCACSATFGGEPNTNVCPVCLGMPGLLPVLNRRVIEFAIRLGLATSCAIAPLSRFARKNYFYPDLVKGYQISMYELPLCTGGHLDVLVDGLGRRIGLTRIHMEEDTGKNIHEANAETSLVDFNRSGVPLLEIVSEPDMRTVAEAGAYLRTLRSILQYLEICDGNMEEGSFRCDANVSVRPAGTTTLGTKVEVKNMNSFRSVENAIAYEIERQAAALAHGEPLRQETRLWDAEREETRPMRSKEFAHDYRYFPEPDLLPLVVDRRWVDEVRATLPELPAPRRERFVRDYQLSTYDADVLTQRKDIADYFEAGIAAGAVPKEMANWVTTELLRIVHEEKLDDALVIRDWPLTPTQLARLAALVHAGTINRNTAKALIPRLRGTTRDPQELVAAEGLAQVSDRGALEAAVADVVARHPAQVAEFRGGKERVLGFLVGQVMKATGGKANPQVVQELMRAALGT